MSSNVHNLLHATEEVMDLGTLHETSTFDFENALQGKTRMLRSGYKNLEQVINRLSELDNLTAPEPMKFFYDIEIHGTNVTVLMNNYVLKKGNRDGWFLSTGQEVIQYCSAAKVSSTVRITGKKLIGRKKEAFIFPLSSTYLFTFECNINEIARTMVELSPSEVFCKLVAIPLNEDGDTFFTPLIHTLPDIDNI